MSRAIRTFVAVETSEAVRRRSGELAELLRAAGAEVKWVEPHNLHFTLAFLGDVAESHVPDVCRAVEQSAAPVAPFALAVRGAGAFPNSARPRTIWLGVGQGLPEMIALHDRIERAIAPMGFRPEGRAFEPHLTIGRVKRPTAALDRLASLLDTHADFDAGQTRVDEVVVFASQLRPSGPVYQPLARARLNGL